MSKTDQVIAALLSALVLGAPFGVALSGIHGDNISDDGRPCRSACTVVAHDGTASVHGARR